MPLDPLELTGGLAIGEGLGGAIADTVTPRLQSFKNGQWAAHKDVPLTAGEAAEVAAENYETFAAMETEASFTGYDQARFQHIYDVTVTAPGFGELIAMLRRSDEVGIDFAHGLRKAKLETQWDAALANLANQRLSATDIAYMVVRGVLPDEGLLGLSLPTSADNLKLPPQHSLNPIVEAARTGWDADRLAMMVGRSGLAMAPGMAAQARFRGILTANDYLLTIARGDLFPAYADPVLEVSRAIPSPGEYAEARLRGWITQAEAEAGAARHGQVPADADLIYKLHGRSLSARQVYMGLARGGTYDGTPQSIPEPFLDAARQSNVRPEWFSLWYADRYSEPSAFVVRTLLTDGAIDAARGATILANSGWSPDLATLVADHYAAGGGTTAVDPHVKKAQTTLYTEAHKAYVKTGLSQTQVQPALTALSVPPTAQQQVFSLWDIEKQLAAEVPPA